ncbi:MAG TPA: hypothetical protein VLL76_09975 [Candidatus Omnitrophota bacterium]|nr:hypothetical protein [Candidatus Omnitrophota bacterium]
MADKGDKIPVIDPAAAPLDTDAEVAGTPTPRAAVKSSLAACLKSLRNRPRPDTFGGMRQADMAHQQRLGRMLFVWVAVLVVLGIAAGWWGLA